MRFRIVLTGLLAAYLTGAAAAQIKPIKKGGDPEAAKIKNPVAGTPDSIAAGRRMYRRMCERCHGTTGKGDAVTTGAQPQDLTDATWEYGATDGEIFAVIRDGVSIDMEGYAGRISDTDIWNIVNFLRSLAVQK
jgi:mono/diheme cytochrome c family protein